MTGKGLNFCTGVSTPFRFGAMEKRLLGDSDNFWCQEIRIKRYLKRVNLI